MVFGRSVNHISASCRILLHSGRLQASMVGSSIFSSHTCMVFPARKGIWGTSVRRHDSCEVSWDGRNMSAFRNRSDTEAEQYHKVTEAEAWFDHSDS
jgi:hypothetical protein